MHPKMEVLDFEGNLISEVSELDALGTIESLKYVNLKGNPIEK